MMLIHLWDKLKNIISKDGIQNSIISYFLKSLFHLLETDSWHDSISVKLLPSGTEETMKKQPLNPSGNGSQGDQ